MILDLSMPRLDGIKFLRAVRKHLQLKDLPVLVLAGVSAPALQEEAMGPGPTKFASSRRMASLCCASLWK